ncbi:ABC transporter G member 22 [Ancistrocladus abbreviatus]
MVIVLIRKWVDLGILRLLDPRHHDGSRFSLWVPSTRFSLATLCVRWLWVPHDDHLSFQDVTYKVMMKGDKSFETAEKYILQGVSGSINPGEILALIAPSGGGKTTLLNLLSGRLKINSGTITYNGQPYSKSFKQRIGFVLQDDLALPHLTVKETLTYAALLRLPNTLTREQKKERALNVISELGL